MRCSKCNKNYKDTNDKDIIYCSNCDGKLIKDNEEKKSNNNLALTITGIVMIGLLFFSIGIKALYSFVDGDYYYNLFHDDYYDDEDYYDEDDYDDEECDKIDWNEIMFKSHFISEKEWYGYIETDDEDDEEAYQYISVCDVSVSEYDNIINEFMRIGYVKVDYDGDTSYYAYDKDNYYLELDYFDRQLNIMVREPKKFSQYKWPEKGAATMIPKPDSNKTMGKIDDDTSRNFMITLRDITKEDYKSYVQKCKDEGYTSNIRDENNSFEANNTKNGYQVMIDYHADNTMDIRVMYLGIYGGKAG